MNTISINEPCCICYFNYPILFDSINNVYLGLNDISDDFSLLDDLLLKSACNVHYICVQCLRKIVNNYENHPINEHNSHVFCPYPFQDCVTSVGTRNIFDHNSIKKLFKTETEWTNFINYANQYTFPGCTVIECASCNSPILIENEEIRNTPVGELVIKCSQNEACMFTFCYYCKSSMSYNKTTCYICKLQHETENPDMFNYYFNKTHFICSPIENPEEILSFNECDYLFKNKELTVEIAQKQIIDTINDTNSILICPICKLSMYKTEQCNALKHHYIERCYACSRIGYKVKGLVEHWSNNGKGGCYRFDHDYFVKTHVREFICNDRQCFSHDMGDCNELEHQHGIQQLHKIRKQSIVYHLLKSLPNTIKYTVFDNIYEYLSINNNSLLYFLPYKQTLFLLSEYPQHFSDFSEIIFYQSINCFHPSSLPDVFTNKTIYIDTSSFLNLYTIPVTPLPPLPSLPPLSPPLPPLPTFNELLLHTFNGRYHFFREDEEEQLPLIEYHEELPHLQLPIIDQLPSIDNIIIDNIQVPSNETIPLPIIDNIIIDNIQVPSNETIPLPPIIDQNNE
jgi:hypothetical protein